MLLRDLQAVFAKFTLFFGSRDQEADNIGTRETGVGIIASPVEIQKFYIVEERIVQLQMRFGGLLAIHADMRCRHLALMKIKAY